MHFKKYLKLALQILFSAGVLWWVAYKLGWHNLTDTFAKISLPVFGLGVGLYLVAQVLSAWRWAVVSQMLGFKGGFWNYNSLYFLGMFYNLFLPTGYGGDVVKALYQSTDRRPPSKIFAAITILLDRLSGLAALLLIGGVASLGLKAQLGMYGALMTWCLVALVVGGIVALFLLPRFAFVPRKLRFMALILRKKWGSLIPVGVLSLIVQLLNIFIYISVFDSLGAQLSFAQVIFAYAVVTIATLLPVSINGLGVRESGWAGLVIAFGAAPTIGFSAGLIYFLVQTVSSLWGLIPFFTVRFQKPAEAQTL